HLGAEIFSPLSPLIWSARDTFLPGPDTNKSGPPFFYADSWRPASRANERERRSRERTLSRQLALRCGFEHRQGNFAFAGVVDDGGGVVDTDPAAGSALLLRRHGPGLVDLLVGDPGEPRDEAADVAATGVEPPGLQHGMEDPEVGRGVGAAPGHPLPAAVVVGEVGVGELVLEPGLPVAPVDVEVLG